MKAGQLIGGRYEIIRHIGTGGMSTIYLAHDKILDRDVAIKFLRADKETHPNALSRFHREALAVSELNHPNIVSVYDIGDEEDGNYIVMEYIDGMSLKEYIRQNNPMALADFQDIMLQILSGMSSAHNEGIIHRDLKPQNIMITKDHQVKIMDFGIALIDEATATLTQTNMIIGSVHYLSPEQARGSLATAASDIYSLGIVGFEMLTGQVPFDGESAVSIALQHFQEPLPNIDDYRQGVPQAVQNVIYKATAKEPNERYHSCQEMYDDLKTALSVDREDEVAFIPSQLSEETVVTAKEDIESQLDETTTVVETPSRKQYASAPLFTTRKEEKIEEEEPKTEQKNPFSSINFNKRLLFKFKWWMGLVALVLFALVWSGIVFAGTRPVPSVTNMSTQDARNALEEAGLAFGGTREEYSTEIDKGLVIETDPSIGTRLKKGEDVTLIVSEGEKPYKVPDFKNKPLEEAKKALEEAGIKVKTKEDYSDTVKKGLVSDQSLEANEEVLPSESTMELTVSKGQQVFKMPDLSGYTRSEVENFAQNAGLKLVENDQFSESIDSDILISQSIAPGSNYVHGQTLTVAISKGSKDAKYNFELSITIPYKEKSSDKESSDFFDFLNPKGNEIQIFIDDENHSLDEPADTFTITRDTEYTLKFVTRGDKQATYRVVRDGEVIMESQVSPDD